MGGPRGSLRGFIVNSKAMTSLLLRCNKLLVSSTGSGSKYLKLKGSIWWVWSTRRILRITCITAYSCCVNTWGLRSLKCHPHATVVDARSSNRFKVLSHFKQRFHNQLNSWSQTQLKMSHLLISSREWISFAGPPLKCIK